MSTTVADVQIERPETDSLQRRPAVTFAVAIASALALALGLGGPNLAADAGGGGMPMTHYMGLLSANQPWNLLLFMAVPVILAETLAITELAILFQRKAPAWVHGISRAAGLVVGPIMLGILAHLLKNAVLPLTASGEWRGPADVIAVGAYALSALPLMAITLTELGYVGRGVREARKWHAIFVGVFLVVAHVAMILGMLDPSVLGWSATASVQPMPAMPGMDHGAHPMPMTTP